MKKLLKKQIATDEVKITVYAAEGKTNSASICGSKANSGQTCGSKANRNNKCA